jgi:tRNA dimethylallyltransferase
VKNENQKIALCIVGPTGVGKTETGIYAAEKLDGEIVSFDSRQMYKFMNIGTDKPPEEYLSRVTHHFIDVIDPKDRYNAGQFGKDARKTIDHLFESGKVPVLVGGSGLYLKAILQGFFDEKVRDLEIKKGLQEYVVKHGTEKLYRELSEIDPEFADKITVNDAQRIVRGIEVFRVTGKPLTAHWKESKVEIDYKSLIIGLSAPRELLYDNINSRVDKMIESGLIDEVKTLKKMGYDNTLNSMKTYGYREVFEYLDNNCTYDEMVESIKQRTRNFAKRQLTWFKKVENIKWIESDALKEKAAGEIVKLYNKMRNLR